MVVRLFHISLALLWVKRGALLSVEHGALLSIEHGARPVRQCLDIEDPSVAW